jgi:hypothetical protein
MNILEKNHLQEIYDFEIVSDDNHQRTEKQLFTRDFIVPEIVKHATINIFKNNKISKKIENDDN